jgi:hypothetical protein
MPSDLVLCGPVRVSGHLHSQTWAGVWPSLSLMRAYSCKRVVSVLTLASSRSVSVLSSGPSLGRFGIPIGAALCRS